MLSSLNIAGWKRISRASRAAGGTLVCAGILAGCSDGSAGKHEKAIGGEAPRIVNTAWATERPLERNISVVGALAAYDQAKLSVKITGRVQDIPVDLGSTVHKGQVVARLDPTDYQLRLKQSEALLAQARARVGLAPEGENDTVEVEKTSVVKEARAVLEEATRNRDRVANLTKQGIVSQSELETVTANYEVALNRYQDAISEIRNRIGLLSQRRAEVNIAREQLKETSLYAPFDGVVQERQTSAGEYLDVGVPVLTIVRMDLLRLRLEVPERETAAVKLKQAVRLTAEGNTNKYTGEIARISPMINETNRMLTVEADVVNPGNLRPGLFARAEIIVDPQDKGLTIPRDALMTFAGVEKVFAVRDGKAVEKMITTARNGADWVEVTSGLEAGEAVVRLPGGLRSGQAVISADTAKK